MTADARRYAPATDRNRAAILALLQRELPARGLVLEIASGSGEHIVYFAGSSSATLAFQPSDPDPSARASIDAWVGHHRSRNVRPAIALDASAAAWPIDRADAILCINMIHISPWSATVGLLRGAARILPPAGLLYLYGPYNRAGRFTSASNEAFDQDLRARNPQWGIRDLESVEALAAAEGFAPPTVIEMPANNLSLVFRHTA